MSPLSSDWRRASWSVVATLLLLTAAALVYTARCYAAWATEGVPGAAAGYPLSDLASTFVWDTVSLALLMAAAALPVHRRPSRSWWALPTVVSGAIVLWTAAAWLVSGASARAVVTGSTGGTVWLSWLGIADPGTPAVWSTGPAADPWQLDALSLAGPSLLVLTAWLPALALLRAAPRRRDDGPSEHEGHGRTGVERDPVVDELRRAATALGLVAVLCLVGLALLAAVGGLGLVMGWYDVDWYGLQTGAVVLGLLAVVVAWVGAGARGVLLLVLGALGAQLVSTATWFGTPSVPLLATCAAAVAWSHRRTGEAAARLLGLAPDVRRATVRAPQQL